MKNLIISPEIEAKLREKHRTKPATEWFIAANDKGQRIKVAIVPDNGKIYLRTAYLANPEEIRIYEKFGY